MKQITLDECALYSPWPARLLALNPKEFTKNKEDIDREYNQDKWGSLFQYLNDNTNANIIDADHLMMGQGQDLVCLHQGQIWLAHNEEIRNHYLSELSVYLQKYKSQSLVELGAGYGHILINLCHQKLITPEQIFALELTENGQNCAKILANRHQLSINVGFCDLSLPQITRHEIPENSTIFTSYSACYLKSFDGFVEKMKTLKPNYVIHFEPMNTPNPSTLLDLLQNKYSLLNHYNSTIEQYLHIQENLGQIQIIEKSDSLFSACFLLPVRCIVWKPLF